MVNNSINPTPIGDNSGPVTQPKTEKESVKIEQKINELKSKLLEVEQELTNLDGNIAFESKKIEDSRAELEKFGVDFEKFTVEKKNPFTEEKETKAREKEEVEGYVKQITSDMTGKKIGTFDESTVPPNNFEKELDEAFGRQNELHDVHALMNSYMKGYKKILEADQKELDKLNKTHFKNSDEKDRITELKSRITQTEDTIKTLEAQKLEHEDKIDTQSQLIVELSKKAVLSRNVQDLGKVKHEFEKVEENFNKKEISNKEAEDSFKQRKVKLEENHSQASFKVGNLQARKAWELQHLQDIQDELQKLISEKDQVLAKEKAVEEEKARAAQTPARPTQGASVQKAGAAAAVQSSGRHFNVSDSNKAIQEILTSEESFFKQAIIIFESIGEIKKKEPNNQLVKSWYNTLEEAMKVFKNFKDKLTDAIATPSQDSNTSDLKKAEKGIQEAFFEVEVTVDKKGNEVVTVKPSLLYEKYVDTLLKLVKLSQYKYVNEENGLVAKIQKEITDNKLKQLSPVFFGLRLSRHQMTLFESVKQEEKTSSDSNMKKILSNCFNMIRGTNFNMLSGRLESTVKTFEEFSKNLSRIKTNSVNDDFKPTLREFFQTFFYDSYKELINISQDLILSDDPAKIEKTKRSFYHYAIKYSTDFFNPSPIDEQKYKELTSKDIETLPGGDLKTLRFMNAQKDWNMVLQGKITASDDVASHVAKLEDYIAAMNMLKADQELMASPQIKDQDDLKTLNKNVEKATELLKKLRPMLPEPPPEVNRESVQL